MTVLFLHLPKTGGSTLNNCLYEQHAVGTESGEDLYFSRGVYYFPSGFFREPGGLAQVELETLSRPDLKVVAGHFDFGLHSFLPESTEVRYVTLLRHPVERVVSLYRHVMHFAEPDRDLHEEMVRDEVRLEDFVERDLPELENDQCRRLAGGFVDGELAGSNLERAFFFVGLTEEFDRSLVMLKRAMGWEKPLQYYPKNVSAEWCQPKSPSDRAKSIIEERNADDLVLYGRLREDFYKRMEVEQGRGLEEDLRAFQEHNARKLAEWGAELGVSG